MSPDALTSPSMTLEQGEGDEVGDYPSSYGPALPHSLELSPRTRLTDTLRGWLFLLATQMKLLAVCSDGTQPPRRGPLLVFVPGMDGTGQVSPLVPTVTLRDTPRHHNACLTPLNT